MIGRLVFWWHQPLSRKLQYLAMRRAGLITQWVHRWRLRACGVRNIVLRPLFWTPEFVARGNGVLVWPGCRLEGLTFGAGAEPPLISLGDKVSLQQHCHVTAGGQLHIGAGTTILSNVVITDLDHLYETMGVSVSEQPTVTRATRIGRNCFIGAGARILAGTQLGDHCVVGTNAVVRGVFPAGSVIVGMPGRIVRRFDPTSGRWQKVDPPATAPLSPNALQPADHAS